jgi:hypothetical protein
LGQRADAATALLCQHRLQHCEDRLRRLSGGLVAHQVGEFVAARFKRAHVTAQVVHEDFWRVGATLHHLLLVVIALVVALISHGVHEPLHDPDVFDVVVHHFVFHSHLLEKARTTGRSARFLHGAILLHPGLLRLLHPGLLRRRPQLL